MSQHTALAHIHTSVPKNSSQAGKMLHILSSLLRVNLGNIEMIPNDTFHLVGVLPIANDGSLRLFDQSTHSLNMLCCDMKCSILELRELYTRYSSGTA